MRRSWLLAMVLLVPLTAGCIGSVDAAEVPNAEDEGWSQNSEDNQEMAFGLVEVVTKEYNPDSTGDTTGVIVASATSIPLFDEERLLPMAIEQVEQERGITLTETGETTVSLSNLGGVEVVADLYEFQKDNVEGQAVLFTVDQCDAFVVVVGFGITDPAGMFGDSTYGEARDMATTVTC